ncbi:hypothetical protein FGO68_gene15429 [Halteria grandinella]|uniref:Uncharacterized protein n=1 Tax=Halteria grandinella TaxID=5974 RepID=A0A8J8NU34_HALGN|nr:hypothetical protein FGO68_gene15429 [Halteria grandinella]
MILHQNIIMNEGSASPNRQTSIHPLSSSLTSTKLSSYPSTQNHPRKQGGPLRVTLREIANSKEFQTDPIQYPSVKCVSMYKYRRNNNLPLQRMQMYSSGDYVRQGTSFERQQTMNSPSYKFNPMLLKEASVESIGSMNKTMKQPKKKASIAQEIQKVKEQRELLYLTLRTSKLQEGKRNSLELRDSPASKLFPHNLHLNQTFNQTRNHPKSPSINPGIFQTQPYESWDSKLEKHVHRQQLLSTQFKDLQIFVMPDKHILSLDLMPQFELSSADFTEKKKKQVSTSEAEEKIVHMRSIDFYSNLNRLSINKLRLSGVKLPKETMGARMTRAKLRFIHQLKMEEQGRQKLTYDDMEQYVADFQRSQEVIAKNKRQVDGEIANIQANIAYDELMAEMGPLGHSRGSSMKTGSSGLLRKPTTRLSSHYSQGTANTSAPPKNYLTDVNLSLARTLKQQDLRHQGISNPQALDLMSLPELMDLDIRENYITKVPECLKSNKFRVKQELFEKHKERLIREKKEMELNVIRANKKQEMIQAVGENVDKYELMRLNSKLRSSTVIEQYKQMKRGSDINFSQML